MKRTHLQRFMRFVSPEPNTGCWLWLGAVDKDGYGFFKVHPRQVKAHRWAYEHWVGPIPDGLPLDHLCRQPGCVNPRHLEAVTVRENTLRGVGPSARNAAKTHCDAGHDLSGGNLFVRSDGARGCRLCRRATGLRFRHANLELVRARDREAARRRSHVDGLKHELVMLEAQINGLRRERGLPAVAPT